MRILWFYPANIFIIQNASQNGYKKIINAQSVKVQFQADIMNRKNKNNQDQGKLSDVQVESSSFDEDLIRYMKICV